MADRGVDFFAEGALPAPRVSAGEAAEIARVRFGIEATAEALGSQQDQNFLLSGPGLGPIGVLKFANRAIGRREIEAQAAAAALLAERLPDLRVATTLQDGTGGPMLDTVETSEGPLVTQVIRYLPGRTLERVGHLSPRVVAALGAVAARVSVALEAFEHLGLDRTLQWDLRHGDRVVESLLGHVPDRGLRARLEDSTRQAWAVVAALADRLPTQPGHFDLTDENVLTSDPRGLPLPDGLIDLGDLSRSWRVGELATTITSILHHPGAEPHTLLPAIQAFHRIRPLCDEELEALWPLVIIRGAVLTVSSHQQIALDGEHTHAFTGLARERVTFERAASVWPAVMGNLIRAALGRPVPPTALPAHARPWLDAPPVSVDLATESELSDEGAWLEPDATQRAVEWALADGQVAVLPYGRPQLTRGRPLSPSSQETVPTVSELWFPRETELPAPWSGDIDTPQSGVTLSTPELRLIVRGHGLRRGSDGLVIVPARTPITVQILSTTVPFAPEHVRPEYAPGWLPLTVDAAPLLQLEGEPQQREQDLIARRERSLASVQEHYYARPPRIERGWRHHLADIDGRVYLDMVNNVTILGHAHPRLQAAVARQLRRLNTNSRFHYAAIAEFSDRLAALLPEPLDSVFLVNSGSEAVDLALRLALAATGRPDVVAMREAYHGWTYLSDAVSTSIADNPNALETRPPWVHTVDAANDFRGRHRGAEAWRYAPEAVGVIDQLAASGRPPAAFIAETFYGNAGGLRLPDGYLEQVYAAVRRHGGLAVADEVQVGYGRLGEWFWGFEQQGVVPDIVAVAKAVGNGHPLGAVITSREVAERYRAGGYFFSSTGGSPVSSIVGLTVLDVIRDECLQENARIVGGRLKRGLEDLAGRHSLIGAVHGAGLYLGVEFVRDRGTLEPATEETAAICDRLLELGVIMQPTGDHQNVLKIKPPLCLDAEAADFFVAMLDEVLTSGW